MSAVPPWPPWQRCAAWVGLLMALQALGACAGASVTPADPASRAQQETERAVREQTLATLDDYRVQGGFGYWDDAQNLTADIDWHRSPDRLSISLRAPLGLGRLDLEQDAAGARVQRSGTPARRGADAGVLLQVALGLDRPVPIAPLEDWIVGLPGDQATAVKRDEQGRLVSLTWVDATGSRWRATVNRYRQVGELSLPALLTAVNGDRHLRLALSDWTIESGKEALVTPSMPARDTPARLRLPGSR